MGVVVRFGRGLVLAGVAVAVVASVASAARSLTPGTPSQPHLPAITAATLDTRYQENRQFILDSERAAQRLGDTGRAQVLAKLAQGGRQFLSFSPVGDGQAVEVLGNLADAQVISVVVPGADTTLDTFDQLGTVSASLDGGAKAVYAQEQQLEPERRVAVIAWYGYDAPRTLSLAVATTDRAKAGALLLLKLLSSLRTVAPAAPVTLLCHSYGTVVCGEALRDLGRSGQAPAGVVVFGSPGMGVGSRAGLGSAVPLWAGRGSTDWITDVPNVSVQVLSEQIGFGADPTSPSFGARVFPAGAGGHSDYLLPGSLALKNISLIALGLGSEVSHV